MKPISALLTTSLFLLPAACAEDSSESPLGPSGPAVTAAGEEAAAEISVMTRNLYVGADADAVIVALASPDPQDDLPALLVAVGTLGETDYPRRAAAIADEIARARPHAVGLQEVSTLDLTLPPLGIDVHLDFLPVLLDELAGRGLSYQVAARVRNFEASVLPGVRLADDDALLVDRDRVTVRGTDARRYTANLGQVAPGVFLARGWVSAAVTVGGRSFTVASTHLESGAAPGLDQLRALQAAELAGALSGEASAIVMGDLNDVPGSPMHQAFTGAGYTDSWAALRPGVIGFTCCHLSDLSNQVEQFDERIDYLLVRGFGGPGDELQGQIARLGALPADRIAGPDHPIWPSDHAGLVLRLLTLAGVLP